MVERRYVGKTCPFCHTKLVETDMIAVCDTCDMPHHLSCWQENCGCTTFGCTGRIREVLGQGGGMEPVVAVPDAVPVTGVAPMSVTGVQPRTETAQPHVAPVTRTASGRRFDVLAEKTGAVRQPGCPVMLEKTVLMKDNVADRVLLRCDLRRLSERDITAVMVDVWCKDVWGKELEGVQGYQYLDIVTKRGSVFGATEAIELPDKQTRTVGVSVRRVMYSDGTVEQFSGEGTVLPEQATLEAYLGDGELVEQFRRQTVSNARFVPYQQDDLWRCTCGAVNIGTETGCRACGCKLDYLKEALDRDALAEGVELFRQKQLERQRQEEERLAKEKKQKEDLLRFEQEQAERERRKKTTRKVLIGLGAVAVAAVIAICVAIFVVIPQNQYDAACQLLDDGKYDEAYSAFVELGDYKDSADMALEALFQKGEYLLEQGRYEEAIAVFQELGDYKDSADMALEALFQKGEYLLEQGRYEEAIAVFRELGDYSDSEEMIKEAKYLKAGAYSESEQYRVAYTLYLELGDYKDSQDKTGATMLLWAANVLGSGNELDVDGFVSTVRLDTEDNELLYTTILLYIQGHEDADYWIGYSNSYRYDKVLRMLEALPSGYQDVTSLKKLFNVLKEGGPEELFLNNAALAEKWWSFGFIQDMAQLDYCVTEFLNGYWSTWDDDYYMEYDDDGYCSYNLPHPDQPSNTKYYDIQSMVWGWYDGNDVLLGKVYQIEIIDYDTIQVYCFKDKRTYTLYR